MFILEILWEILDLINIKIKNIREGFLGPLVDPDYGSSWNLLVAGLSPTLVLTCIAAVEHYLYKHFVGQLDLFFK